MSPSRDQVVDVMESEKQVIQRAIQGDEAAMRALWSRHAPHVDAVVRRLVGNDLDLAADVAQEVWIQIFRALPGYRGDSQFGTWAHRIAVNRTLNALRKVRRIARVELDIDEESPGARTVFTLHDVEAYTHEEIARELGITAGGSKSQLAKARAKLRRMLAHL